MNIEGNLLCGFSVKLGKGWLAGMNTKKIKEIAMDLICDVAGAVLYALGIYTFAKTGDFAPGGLSGLSLIINHLCGIPIGIMTLILNIPFVLLSFRIIGKGFLMRTARSMILCTICLDVIFPQFPPYTGSPFMAALFSGLCIGAGLSLFYMRGSSSGGTDFLIMSVKALRPHFSIGTVTIVIDFVVIMLGWPVFGSVDSVLYGLVAVFATSIVVDKIMNGIGSGTLTIIITTHGQIVADRIGEVIGRGSTAIQARGTYTNEGKEVLMCACSSAQGYIVRRTVHEADPDAFVMMTETSEVFGEGFLEKK